MPHLITITVPAADHTDREAISLDQYYQRRAQRKQRVAKRLYQRAPLFAVEFMREEFPEATVRDVVEAVTRPTRKRKSMRTKKNGLKKNGLKKYGRFPLYFAALERYHATGDTAALIEAQGLRDRIAKDFLFEMRCQGEVRTYRLPATASLRTVQRIAALKFSSWEDLNHKWGEVTKWGI